MFTDAQQLGKNAMLTINGTSITSTSNTITSDISRISDVTIELKGVTTPDESGSTKTTRLEVGQDTSGLVDAVKGFVDAYNSMMAKVELVTGNGGDLDGETSLTSITRTLRNYVTSGNSSNGGAFKHLAQIGISTGKADGSSLSDDISSLKFDEAAFKKALEEDPASVEAILAGEDGILSMMENTVEMSLKATTGFFDIKDKTLTSDISKMQDKITKQNKKVETYRTQLENKFANMELMIAQMQQNYSNFLGG
jgi:flagellar hook-associated protein 2